MLQGTFRITRTLRAIRIPRATRPKVRNKRRANPESFFLARYGILDLGL